MSQPLLRVLVVDDSAFNRKTIAEMLVAIDGVEVVGKATDGDEALRLAAQLEPDLVTLDLEMPRMDGFTFLRLLMARRPTPVLVVSGYSDKENVFRALELGAVDFVAKPTRTVTTDLAQIGDELARKVSLLRNMRARGLVPQIAVSGTVGADGPERPASRPPAVPREPGPAQRVVVVGASTGGPTALVRFFRRIPPHVDAAFVIAQHMPERFTMTFADRLDRLGGPKVREASDRHLLRVGEAWVCPGGRSAVIEGRDLVVLPPGENDRYVPSVDRLFASAAAHFGERTIGAVLTGMGDDGAEGTRAIAERGGTVFAEAPDTAVIYGMPGAAVRTGRVEAELPLPELAQRIASLLRG